jgi:hypothetical protein
MSEVGNDGFLSRVALLKVEVGVEVLEVLPVLYVGLPALVLILKTFWSVEIFSMLQ